MESAESPAVARVIARATGDPDVLAVIVFGSQARGEASPASDYDVCLVLAPGVPPGVEATRKRLDYLAGGDLDVVVFHQLPLHIRSRVLKEGRILFVRDEDALYALAVRTAQEWERFRNVYRAYLEEVARG